MIRVLLILVFSLYTAAPTWAAIAIGSVYNSTITASQTTSTVSVTVGAGSDRVLVCGVYESGTDGTSGVTSVVFNSSESLTIAHGNAYTTTAPDYYLTTIWTLVNPSVTTANVVVTYTASGTADTFTQAVTCIPFTGVDQAAPEDAQADGEGNSATISATVTTVAADAWVIDAVMAQDAITVGSGQTQRMNQTSVGQWLGMSTVNGKASPGAEAMDWTLAANHWLSTAISLKPAAAAGGSITGLGGVNPALFGGR